MSSLILFHPLTLSRPSDMGHTVQVNSLRAVQSPKKHINIIYLFPTIGCSVMLKLKRCRGIEKAGFVLLWTVCWSMMFRVIQTLFGALGGLGSFCSKRCVVL